MPERRLARVGLLAAGVAHTVRNPLHGVVNCVDMLQRKYSDDTDTQEIVELMAEGTQRIATVTDRLLKLSREAPLQRSMTDLRVVLNDVARFVEPAAAERGIALRVEAEGSKELMLDAAPLVEALVAVVDNAVQACGRGDTVTLRSCGNAADDQSARIEIVDTGPGIPEEALGRVFEPFFTTKAVAEGSGLGLAICRRVVLEHGGDVSIETEQGEGTVVTIDLPQLPDAMGAGQMDANAAGIQ